MQCVEAVVRAAWQTMRAFGFELKFGAETSCAFVFVGDVMLDVPIVDKYKHLGGINDARGGRPWSSVRVSRRPRLFWARLLALCWLLATSGRLIGSCLLSRSSSRD
eukprot:11212014-Alexandrium_andersonii.AAC.1